MPRFVWWKYIDLRSFLIVIHQLEFKYHFVPWIHCESVSPHFVIFLDNHCHKVLICCQHYYLTWYFLFLLTLIIISSIFASATMQKIWLVIPDPEKILDTWFEYFKEVDKKCTVILSPFSRSFDFMHKSICIVSFLTALLNLLQFINRRVSSYD